MWESFIDRRRASSRVTEATPLDDRGRFTLKPEFRKHVGSRIVQVLTPDGILIMPVRRKLLPGTLPPSLSLDGDALHAEEEAGRRGEPG
jgi:hypothetical protein